MNLLMIPFHDWKKCEREGFRTRDGHFMREFGKHANVEKLLIVNRPVSFSEIAFLKRNWRVKNGRSLVKRNMLCLSQVDDGVFTLDILVPEIFRPVLMRRSWTPYIFKKRKIAEAINFSLKCLNMDESYALIISAPLFAPVMHQLSPAVFVLDALDNLLKLVAYKNVHHLKYYYRFCLERTDWLTTNSPETLRWFKRIRPDATCIPNGVDFHVFNTITSHCLPSDIKSISGPIVGYAGKMQEMLDIDLMKRVVTELPEINFVFIGQRINKKWVKGLWRYPNVYYLGDKAYKKLPAYLSSFDICIIPYSMERQHGVDPIKFYEYIAMGKPVVTTNIGDVDNYKDFPQVKIGRTHSEFIKGIRFFIEKIRLGVPIITSPLPDECSWNRRADKIVKKIDKLILHGPQVKIQHHTRAV